MGNLPPDLTGPVALELAKAVEQLPGEHGLPGGACYELKWTASFTELCQLPVMRPRGYFKNRLQMARFV